MPEDHGPRLQLSRKEMEFAALELLERHSNPIWVYDFEAFAIIWANHEALSLWGARSIDELSARQLRDDMSDSVATRLAQYRADFAKDCERTFVEMVTLYPNNHPVSLECTFKAISLVSGRECALIEGRLETKNTFENQRYIDALLHSQIMTALYREDGVELFSNRAFREALGPGPFAFGRWFENPIDRETFLAGLRGSGHHRETIAVMTASGKRHFDVHAVRCHDPATGDAAFQISATDVSVAVRAEKKLKAAHDKALAANQAKSDFVANLSHEMRTPMNGILGMTEILSYTRLTPEQSHQLEIIRNSARALMALIEDTLDLSSIELRAVVPESAPLDIHKLARDVIEGLEPHALQKGLSLRLYISSDLPAHWIGDSRRIAQLIRNLVGNAIKYTALGYIELNVRQVGTETVRFEVSDTGPGVPAGQRERIFEKFHQAGPTLDMRRKGFGLGLAICKEIVSLLGGEIGVLPVKPHGACFWFTLPLIRTVEVQAKG